MLYMEKAKEKWCAALAVFVCGFMAHGYFFTNKISYHDDSCYYFGVGMTFGSGRWALGLIQKVMNKVGFLNYSSSWWNGGLCILLTAVCAVLLVELLQIRQKSYAVLLGALLIAFPAMASLFAYMFTAPYYMFAVLLMIVAVYTAVRYPYGYLPAIVIIAFSMGIYQTYFGVATSLFVLILLRDMEDRSFAQNVMEAFKYLFTLLGGMLLYFLCNRVCIKIFQITLVEYQGINNMANVTMRSLIGSVKRAYLGFFQPIFQDLCGISSHRTIRFLYLLIYIIAGGLVTKQLCKKEIELWNRIYFFVLCWMIPLSLNIIYVMSVSDKTVIHTLMIYPYLIGLLYPMVFLKKENLHHKIWKSISMLYCVVASLLSVYYMKLDNVAYLKADYQQQTAISYYTEVISQIKDLDGYNSKMPVLFYGTAGSKDESIPEQWQFDVVDLQGYGNNMHDFIAYYADKDFIELHCGYTYQEPENRDSIISSMQFQEMPQYPCDGSIKIIDGVVVVKWSNIEVR